MKTFHIVVLKWFTQGPGHIIRPKGDAYLLSQCYNETNYTVFWNHTYNNTCFSRFPVYLHSQHTIKYLSLTERRLYSYASTLPCENIPDITYVADRAGVLWSVDVNGTISVANYSKVFLPAFSNSILRLGHLNSKLLQFIPEPFETFSLLEVLVRSQETLEQLESIRAADEDNNVALGIGKIIGSTLSGISSGGSHIIKALGSALHGGLSGLGDLDSKVITSLGKATGNIIDSSGRAFEHVARGTGGFFHDVLGGLSGSLLWGAFLLLTLFCVYHYIQKNGIGCNKTTDTTSDISTDDIDDSEPNMTEPDQCVDCGLPRCLSVSNNLSQASAV